MRKILYSFLFITSALFSADPVPTTTVVCDGKYLRLYESIVGFGSYRICGTTYNYPGTCESGHFMEIYNHHPDSAGTYCQPTSYSFAWTTIPDCSLTPETPLWDTVTHTCIATPTCEANYIYSVDFSTCVPDCSLVANLTLNSAGDTCECLSPFTAFTINALPPVCDLDSDGDLMPDTYDEFPLDKDNDGIPDLIDQNPDVADNTPVFDAQKCDQYPPLSTTGSGWHTYTFQNENECDLNYLNTNRNGSQYYISDIVEDICFGACGVFQSMCPFPKKYNVVTKSCEQPLEDECLPDPASTKVVQISNVCYEQLTCIGSSKLASSNIVTCPDADQDGTPDSNVSSIGMQESMLGALTQYGASTSSKQDTIIDKLESQLSKLATINDTGKDGNIKLKSIDGKLTVLETTLKAGNTKLDGIATTNTLLGTQNSKLDAVIGNQLAQLTKADQSNTFLDDILNSFGDFNLSDITSMLSGTDATIDYATAGLDTGISKYSGITPFYDGTCGVCPTISGVVMGANITLFSQATIDLMPMDIFRGMIIFFFALAGIIMAFRTV